jgi:replicative DNA helicase
MSTFPAAFDTERALLGALLTSPKRVIRDCWAAGLTPADFDQPAHQLVYETIVESIAAGDDLDEVAVHDQLRRRKVAGPSGQTVAASNLVGGLKAIMELADNACPTPVARRHADEIVSVALSRELVRAGHDLATAGTNLESIPDAVAAIETRLARARDRAEGRHDGARISDIGSLVEQFVSEYLSSEPEDTIPFDLDALNDLGGGMYPGDVVVVGARSGVGKSWTGLANLERTIQAGRRTALFSMEMPAPQMVRRLIAMGGHRLTPIRRRLTAYEQIEPRAVEVGNWTGKLDIFDGSTTVDRIQGILSSARIDGRPFRLVVIDHIHLLQILGSDYRLGLNNALTRIKHMAIEHGCSIMLLAQLKRPRPDMLDHPPTIHDLRESGGLGDIADYVLMLHRDHENGVAQNTGSVIVEKVRDGAGSGDIPIRFDTNDYHFKPPAFIAGTPQGRGF